MSQKQNKYDRKLNFWYRMKDLDNYKEKIQRDKENREEIDIEDKDSIIEI